MEVNDQYTDEQLTQARQKVKDQKYKTKLDELQKLDTVKTAYVPFTTLGKEMVTRIPIDIIVKNVLITSDLGLLISVLRARKGQETTGDVWFVCHIAEQCEFAKCELGVHVVYAPYEKLDLFFSCKGEYSFLKDMKFDAIMGNPPFNPAKKEGGKPEGRKIWQRFIEVAYKLRHDHTHMVFVCPNNWRMSNILNGPARGAQELVFSNLQWYRPITEFVNCDIWETHDQTSPFALEFPTLHAMRLLPNDGWALPLFEGYFSACSRDADTLPFFKGYNPRKKGPDGSSKREHNDLVRDSNTGDAAHPYRMCYTTRNAEKDIWDWATWEPQWYTDLKVTVTVTLDVVPRPFFTTQPYGTWGSVNAYRVSTEQGGNNVVEFLQSPLVRFICKQVNDPLGRQLGVASSNAFPAHLFRSIPASVESFGWSRDVWQASAAEAFGLTMNDTERVNNALSATR